MINIQHIYTLSLTWDGKSASLQESSGYWEKDLIQLQKDIENLKVEDTLTDTDQVLFSTYSEVPRYKFNVYAKDKPKLSRVITTKKANAVVLNKEKMYPSLGVQSYGSQMYELTDSDVQFLNMKELQGKTIYLNEYYVPYLTKNNGNFSTAGRTKIKWYGYNNYNHVENEKEIAINEILGLKDMKLVSDVTVLELINQGTIIDQEMYQELTSMLRSDDKDNIGLGMEVMANSDYKASELRLVLLLNMFKNKLMSHKNYGLVNFRSLLLYFQKYSWQHNTIPFMESIVKNSDKAASDYEERIELVKSSVKSHLNDYLGGAFSVESVGVNN